jgi:hypothetical protein
MPEQRMLQDVMHIDGRIELDKPPGLNVCLPLLAVTLLLGHVTSARIRSLQAFLKKKKLVLNP